MKGRKISKDEFKRNYVNVDQSEVNRPLIKPEPEPEMIYNPVTLKFYAVVAMTDKGVCVLFEKNGAECWFPRALSRINNRVKQITVPKKFIDSRQEVEEIIADVEDTPKDLTEFFGKQTHEKFVQWRARNAKPR